jgi:hypothetical protein
MDITVNLSPWILAIVAATYIAHLMLAPAKGGAK